MCSMRNELFHAVCENEKWLLLKCVPMFSVSFEKGGVIQ